MATSLPTSQHSTTQEVYGKSTSLIETNTSTKANWISIMTSSTLLRDHSTTASMNMSVSEMPSTVTVMAVDNTTVNYTTTDISKYNSRQFQIRVNKWQRLHRIVYFHSLYLVVSYITYILHKNDIYTHFECCCNSIEYSFRPRHRHP